MGIREESLQEMDIEDMSEGQESSEAEPESEEEQMDLINLGDYKESDVSQDQIDADPKSFEKSGDNQNGLQTPPTNKKPEIEVNQIEEFVIPADMPPLPPIKDVKVEPVTYANDGLLSDLTKQIDDSIERLAKNIEEITEETKMLNRQREEIEDKKRELEKQYE